MGPDETPSPSREPSAALSVMLGADLEDLLTGLLERVGDVLADQQRLRLLLDAVVTIAGDLSLDGVLQRIVDVASQLADARYVALGVLGAGPGRGRLRAFVTHGLSPEEYRRIGDLPRGHGLLGLIVDRPEPLRLHDIAEHPLSYGFPPGHPPMRSFLGLPVRIRDRVFGNLYLTEKEGGGDFTERDEEIVRALAAAAGVVIENARLYEEAARRERWLAATADLTGLLLGDDRSEDPLQAVADRARVSAAAGASSVVLRRSDTEIGIAVVSGVDPGGVGDVALSMDRSLAGHVISTGETLVIEDPEEDSDRARELAGLAGWPDRGPMMLVPLQTTDGVTGALTLAWAPEDLDRFHEVDVRLPQQFAEQAGLALQVARARADRERLAVFEDRDRIGRDLHDLVIQRLFAVGLGLENTARMAADRPDVAERVARAVDDLDSTIKDIRRTIFALSAPEESTDVRRALSDLVDRAARTLKFRPELALSGPVGSVVGPSIAPDLLAVLGEALSNVARHAGAHRVQVSVEAGDRVTLRVRDDGRGIPEAASHSGLLNMRKRAEELGGSCVVDSAPGAGTTVVWQVPAR